MMPDQPSSADIRQFLFEFFSDEELSTLCSDYFPQVYENFAAGMTKQQKIALLLGYCQHRGIVPNLLGALEKERAALYEKRFPPASSVQARAESARPVRDPRQVFISHAHEDAEFAHQLAIDLRQHGWRVWIAPDSIRPGEMWGQGIDRGLAESGVLVLVLTPRSVQSNWVSKETYAAIQLESQSQIKFIPLEVEPCDVPGLLSTYQRISFQGDYGHGLTALFDALEPERRAQREREDQERVRQREAEGQGRLAQKAAQPAAPAPLSPGTTEPAPSPSASPRPTGPPAPYPAGLPPDQFDDFIVVELPMREWTIDVEQTATCQINIANGGPLVASFQVSVLGLDDTWCAISPPQINLFEGGRGTATIVLSAPRLPASRAGPHPFSIVAISPEYPGRAARCGAILNINPYHEFSIGEISPRRQNISYRQRSGQAVIPIANQGTGEMTFRIVAEDDQGECFFEFEMPGAGVRLVGQAEVRIPPGETLAVPIFITPRHRPVVGSGKNTYWYTVTVTPLEGKQTTRSVLGEVHITPLIGA